MIVLAILAVVVWLQNPLALLALTFLQMDAHGPELPRFMVQGGDDDDDSKPIGFTADIA
jgi:hypothetical protein